MGLLRGCKNSIRDGSFEAPAFRVYTFLPGYIEEGTRYRSAFDQNLFLDKLLTLPMGNLDRVAR